MSAGDLSNRRDFSRKAVLAGAIPAMALAGHSTSDRDTSAAVDISQAIQQLARTAKDRSIADNDILPAEKTAFIIIDMINLFCDPKWMSGGNQQTEAWLVNEFASIIPNLQRVLQAFRQTHALIVHVMNAKWTPDSREVVRYQQGRDYGLFDSERMSVIDALKPRPGEIQIRKVTSSAFTATGLDFMLRNAGIENVVFGGQYGNACVFYSMIQSREFGFRNYWVDDAILYGNESSRMIFEPLVGTYWAKLATTPDIVRVLRSNKTATS